MNNDLGLLVGMTVCALLLLAGAMKGKIEWLMNLVMRSVLGAIGIYFTNAFLASMGISLGVGLNALTILTSGILGIPGFLALYGLAIYQLL